MMTLRRSLYKLAAILLLAVGASVPFMLQHASAQTSADEVCAGIAAASGSGCNGSQTSLNSTVGTAINIFSIVIAIVAVIMIMVAGFKYITSGGDSSQIGSAKNALVYAVIGLVVVALAQSIVKFVLQKVK